MIDIIIGDCRIEIPKLEDQSIDCIMTSPPYWGLRDYGHSDQLGLESTPEEYLKNMLNVFDLVKPKLKDIGNCFVNLGDTYSTKSGGMAEGKWNKLGHNKKRGVIKQPKINLPDKCLCMIPQRFAWGMIEHGWILRNEIIWHKPNHMPESVTDRLTKSHEVIYHFVKQGKYYYDLDAIREPLKTDLTKLKTMPKFGGNKYPNQKGMEVYSGNEWNPLRIDINESTYQGKFEDDKTHESYGSPRARTQRKNDGTPYGGNGTGFKDHSGCYDAAGNCLNNPLGKNPGDVWEINTQPYSEAHFAVFPLKLVEKPILAGCPVGGRVLDMFGGSGTVAEFCRHNERECTIIELNDDYRQLIKNRSMVETPLLSKWDNYINKSTT